MDFVTITDHDCIDGCLAIADKSQTFISEQVSTYFPQDPCKIHALVWGITPAQHQDISVFRSNVFDLQKYLAENRIAHAIAHPLYSVNGKLTASHLERLILRSEERREGKSVDLGGRRNIEKNRCIKN